MRYKEYYCKELIELEKVKLTCCCLEIMIIANMVFCFINLMNCQLILSLINIIGCYLLLIPLTYAHEENTLIAIKEAYLSEIPTQDIIDELKYCSIEELQRDLKKRMKISNLMITIYSITILLTGLHAVAFFIITIVIANLRAKKVSKLIKLVN